MLTGTPFAALVSAIRGWAGIARDSPAEKCRKLEAGVARSVPSERRDWWPRFLGEMVGLPFHEQIRLRSYVLRDAIPKMMGDRMLASWLDWPGASAACGPLVDPHGRLALVRSGERDLPRRGHAQLERAALAGDRLCASARARALSQPLVPA